jgi:hypothetical protein
MSNRRLKSLAGICLAAVATTSMIAGATVADAQGYPSDSAPPQGQYAPPPPGYEQGGAAYDDQSQQADREYAAQYSQWAARYCVDQHNNNTAAGAIIGGVLGAALGAAAGGRNAGAGALVGGALGAGTGAAIGASSSGGPGCPPGYVVVAGAPAFYWGGPPVATWGPAWYHPWVWAGGRWVYHPYRYWYWQHRAYWGPGWHARPWHYRYERW